MSSGPDIVKPLNIIESLREGKVEECGIPLMSGINASDLSDADLPVLLDRKYDQIEEEEGPQEEWLSKWMPPGF